jgi:hypothetical protein
MLSIAKLSDVNGEPKVKLDLPGPLRIGDPLALSFTIERHTGGRLERLSVNGKFRVEAIGFDTTSGPSRQLLSLSSVDMAPTWKSIKKRPTAERRLGPTRFPRTPI